MNPPEGFETVRVVNGPVSIEVDRDGDALIESGPMRALANRSRSNVLVCVPVGPSGEAVSFSVPALGITELIVVLSAAQSYLAMVDDPRDAA